MNSLLTRGLRRQSVRDGGDWHTLLTSAVRGEWPAPEASQQTLEAERGLGIGGKPYYFYVLRAVDGYGFVVFVLSEVENIAWPAHARGATPFDSGGLWWGKVATRPELDKAGRGVFFQDQDVPLVDWRAAFEQYVHTHYGAINDYLKGRAPESESQPPTRVTIIKRQPNTAQAWTWELRIPHSMIGDRVRLRAVYMDAEDRDDYINWLWDKDSPLTDRESSQIGRWVEKNVIVPKQGETAVQEANAAIALEIANG